jgi:hypothetical protein
VNGSVFIDRILGKIGVVPYLRRQWRDDQQKSSQKLDMRLDKHLGRLDSRMATVADRLESLKELSSALADATARLEGLEQGVKSLTRQTRQLRAVLLFNAEHRERRHGPRAFEEDRVARHVAAAIDRTTLETDPMAHLVVDRLMPPETYDALVDAIPPAELFGDKDPRKQNFKLHTFDVAPEWTLTALGFMEDCLIPRMIVPGLLQKFEAHVSAAYSRKYGPTLGAQVAAIPHIATAGRLMLRRPGYHLDPHLDPDRVVVTCLIYFARPGDDESYGTSFYRIEGDPVIDRRNTFYPGQAGHRCDLVKTAPFRPNTAVAFVNAGGAHGAGIPASAPPDTERYAYQFYVSPEPAALAALVPSMAESVE